MAHSSTNQQSIAIIGAGLAGLYLAHLLVEKRGKPWADQHLRIYEARARVGGRILGIPAHGIADHYLDAGPSWIWPQQQPLMTQLLTALQLPVVRQWQQGAALYQFDRQAPAQRYSDTQTYADAYRLAGGTVQLVNALLATLPPSCLQLNHSLTQLCDEGNQVALAFENQPSACASQAILSMPPRLIGHQIAFLPELDPKVQAVMQNTPTWMAGHAKVAVQYETPFWRQQGFSGAAMASFMGAPLGEIFDACGPQANPAVLGAFMALPAALRREWRQDLRELVLDQLIHLFGEQAAQPICFHIQDWAEETHTATADDAQPPMDHPEYGHPWLALDHWHDKLHFCGTETEREGGGYMEGALRSAERILHTLNLSFEQEIAHV